MEPGILFFFFRLEFLKSQDTFLSFCFGPKDTSSNYDHAFFKELSSLFNAKDKNN
jgi:hypothetical protein